VGYTSVRKCILIEIRTKFNLIHEKEWTGDTISNICKRYDVSRKTYYKWKNRYEKKGIEGLSDTSRRPHNIKHKKVTPEVEETIIDLRLTKRFGCNRIKFRLRRIIGLSLSTRTIYKTLNRHGLNILKCNANTRTYRRFAMRHSNDMVQIDILGPFYMHNSSKRNYFISCLDDCSRKVVGLPTIADEIVLTQGTVEERRLVAAYGQNGRIVAALAVNAPLLLPAYQALIEARAPFPPELHAADGPVNLRPVPAGFPPQGHTTHSPVAAPTGPGPSTPEPPTKGSTCTARSNTVL
jgi:transposase